MPRNVPCDEKMHRPKFRTVVPGEDSDDPTVASGHTYDDNWIDPGQLTLNSYDSYEDLDPPSFASDLDWASWCNLSDHRPMVVHFDIYALKKESN